MQQRENGQSVNFRWQQCSISDAVELIYSIRQATYRKYLLLGYRETIISVKANFDKERRILKVSRNL